MALAEQIPNGKQDPDFVSSEKLVGRRGRVADFLRHDFLPGHPVFENHPDLGEQVPLIVERLLYPIVASPHVETVIANSSMPKMMATHANPHFWEIADAMRSVNEHMANQIADPKKEFLKKTFLSYPGDFDTKVQLTPEATLYDVANDVLRYLGVTDFEFVFDEHTDRPQIEAVLDGFPVTVEVGKITTSKRSNMTLRIHDPKTHEEVMHIDMSPIPKGAQEMLVDKRLGRDLSGKGQGTNAAWQDSVIATLKPAGSNPQDGIIYELSPQALQTIKRPNIIWTDSHDPIHVLEVCFRALRDVELYGYALENHTSLEAFLPKFDHVMRLRRHIQNIILRHEGELEGVTELIQRELNLDLTINPYETVQFLRDSGASVLIPGLRRMTPELWHKVLLSNAFAITNVSRDGALYKVQEQMDVYVRGQDPDGFNGIRKFIDALRQIDIDLLIPRNDANAIDYMNDLWVGPNGIGNYGLDRLNSIVSRYINKSNGNGYDEDNLRSIALVYAFLLDFRSGLFAEEMADLYKNLARSEDTPFSKFRFEDVFLLVKMRGLVGKKEIKVPVATGYKNRVIYYPLFIAEQNSLRAMITEGEGVGSRQDELNTLQAYGITTYQALASMTRTDYEILVRMRREREGDERSSFDDLESAEVKKLMQTCDAIYVSCIEYKSDE